MKIEEQIRGLITGPLKKKDFKLISVNYEYEDDTPLLKIVIDQEEIVDLDKCVEATKIINDILDKENIIDHYYVLDVSALPKGGEKNGQ